MRGLSGLRTGCDSDGRRFTNTKPEEFVDPSFIAELDKSGFIKKLYGQK